MKIRKAVIIYKKSTFQIQAVEHREPHFLKLVEDGNPAVTRVRIAHQEHYLTLDRIQTELRSHDIEFSALARADVTQTVGDADLVVSVGGDGTFLDAAHFVGDTPLLGVNSSRSSSFGHFCLAQENTFGKILDDVVNGKLKPRPLLRLQLTLNGRKLPEPVLNEVLICHSNPAGTSRYFIEIGAFREEQRSSGLWIGPPAGSTGALRASGGVVLPIVAMQYQYVVREPSERPTEHWRLLKGILERGESIKLTSQMRTGALYLDGAHIEYPFSLGDELTVRGHDLDLMAFVNPQVNDVFRSPGAHDGG